MGNIIECKNLTKQYKGVTALKGVNFTVPDDGGVFGLLGPNGSGKTTFIKLVTGLLTATEGSVQIDGKEIGVETKEIVSYLPDSKFLTESYTVKEQVDYYADFFEDFDREKAERRLEELGIKPKQKIKTLSKGTKEKLGFVLTLSRKAKLFIFDEPIAGVDPAAREYIIRTILDHREQNATVLISTHLIADIEPILDYVVFLKEGEVVLEGKAEEIKSREGKTIDELFREKFRW